MWVFLIAPSAVTDSLRKLCAARFIPKPLGTGVDSATFLLCLVSSVTARARYEYDNLLNEFANYSLHIYLGLSFSNTGRHV